MAVTPEEWRPEPRYTVIGPGAELKGSLELQHGLHVFGLVEGDRLVARGALLVEPEGQVVCRRIQVGRAVIRGRVVGELVARERVDVASVAQFTGWLATPLLTMEEGARVVADPAARQDGALPEAAAAASA